MYHAFENKLLCSFCNFVLRRLYASSMHLAPIVQMGTCSFISRAQLRLLVTKAVASSNMLLHLSSSATAAATKHGAGGPLQVHNYL